LKHFRNITLAVLTGFMLGSLNKVWPWKETVETFVDSHGVIKPLIEVNAMPDQYILEAALLALAGFFLVYVLEKLSSRKSAG
jgi:putative membrane protein